MRKTMKRIISMVLTLMLVAGLVPVMNATKASASINDFRDLKAGGAKLVTNITPSKTLETMHLYVPNPSKVTFKFSTDLSSGANINIKKGIDFVMVESKINLKNGETKSVDEFLSAGDYYITVAREGMNESGKITTSCTAKTLDSKNDRQYNSTLAEATDLEELTQSDFKGSFLYDDPQDTFKITFQDTANLQFRLEALTNNSGIIKVEVGKLDASGDLMPSFTGDCSKSATKSNVINFNQTLGAGTYYIRLTSTSQGEYRFSSKNITAVIDKLTVKKKVTLKVGKTAKLITAIKPAGAVGTIQIDIADDSKIELVSVKNGKIKANKIGKTKVTITIPNGKSYVCNVTVKK